jgi:hypothetical protein
VTGRVRYLRAPLVSRAPIPGCVFSPQLERSLGKRPPSAPAPTGARRTAALGAAAVIGLAARSSGASPSGRRYGSTSATTSATTSIHRTVTVTA